MSPESAGAPVIFFPTQWALRYFGDTNKKIKLYELPPPANA